MMISLLNSKKAVRIQQFTDGATIVLRKQYNEGLNKIKYGFSSTFFKVYNSDNYLRVASALFLK